MQLKKTGQIILRQIYDLTYQLSDSEYRAQLELLDGNSIGKHVRHIVEFFRLLINGSGQGLINYDRRKHALEYETSTESTCEEVELLINEIVNIDENSDVLLEVSYTKTDSDTVKIKSSVGRELAYNIEHAIHHMAIIKIAVQAVFPNIQLAENFGVAYSTVRYQQSISKSKF